jgi:hypothetical protein
LSPLQRERLEQIIKENSIAWRTLHIEAHEIDQQRANKINLNEIEYRAMVHLLKSIRYSHAQESKRFNTTEVIDRLQIDSVENNAPKLQQRYQTEFPSDVQIGIDCFRILIQTQPILISFTDVLFSQCVRTRLTQSILLLPLLRFWPKSNAIGALLSYKPSFKVFFTPALVNMSCCFD